MTTFGLTATYVFIICWITGSSIMAAGGWTAIPMWVLGILTFLGTFVPYVGAIASAVPGLIVGLAQSPMHFVYALLVYIGVHLVEGYMVSPYIMKRSVHLRPGWLLFWQLLQGQLQFFEEQVADVELVGPGIGGGQQIFQQEDVFHAGTPGDGAPCAL